ncbi:MAG: winged helix-turn-helix domain-containing protein [Terriglobia bacterium]
MEDASRSVRAARFGPFEADLRAGELLKNGRRIRLQNQPLQILAMLLEHPGEVVTREELRQKLWPSDTFVDFDHGLNNAINRLREVLGDSAEDPRFIETLPRRGYRFIAAMENVTRDSQVGPLPISSAATMPGDGHALIADGGKTDSQIAMEEAPLAPAVSPVVIASVPQSVPWWRRPMLWGLTSVVVAAVTASAVWYLKPTAAKPLMRLNMTVAPAEQLTGFQ